MCLRELQDVSHVCERHFREMGKSLEGPTLQLSPGPHTEQARADLRMENEENHLK